MAGVVVVVPTLRLAKGSDPGAVQRLGDKVAGQYAVPVVAADVKGGDHP